MIEILKKYYDIEITDYKEYREGILFFINGNYYYFVKTIYDYEYLMRLLDICLYAKKYKIKLHDFVFNREGRILSEEYVLFKLNVLISEIEFKDVCSFNILLNEYKDEYVKLEKFWEDKIDYLEYQLSEFCSNKLINNSFDYFVGIGEVLLSFYKDNYIYDDNVFLVHRLINSLSTIDFYNPLNITIGCKYKDVVSFIKFTNSMDILFELLDRVSDNDKIYLFVRMAFPFKYFNIINEMLFDGLNDQKLTEIINNIDKYELYLKEMEKIFGIYLFSWIKKE